MIVEAKQQYRGVPCLHCHQPIPLSYFAASKECGFKEQEASGRDESTVRSFTVCSFTLRCQVCEGEGRYTALDVIDCNGTPRIRSSQVRKLLPICAS
jgi:DnaJ-class molecular chaperone